MWADLVLNWTVLFAPLSPAKLSLYKIEESPDMWNENTSDSAIRHDQRELYGKYYHLKRVLLKLRGRCVIQTLFIVLYLFVCPKSIVLWLIVLLALPTRYIYIT